MSNFFVALYCGTAYVYNACYRFYCAKNEGD